MSRSRTTRRDHHTWPDAPALEAALRVPVFGRAIVALPAGVAVGATAMQRRFYSAAGEIAPRPLAGAFAYSVRYHRPAADEGDDRSARRDPARGTAGDVAVLSSATVVAVERDRLRR